MDGLPASSPYHETHSTAAGCSGWLGTTSTTPHSGTFGGVRGSLCTRASFGGSTHPAAGKGSWLLRATPLAVPGVHPTSAPRGAPSARQFWLPVPPAPPAASAEPPSRAFTAHSLRGWGWVSASCWGLSMPAGGIWVKSAPPRTKGRLPSGMPGAAHPGEPRAPHKVLPRPQPSGTDHRGGSAGAPAALWGAPHLPPPLECTGGPQSRRLCQGHAG